MNFPTHKSERSAPADLNANLKTHRLILTLPCPNRKQWATAQADFALLGHQLEASRRAEDGLVTYWLTAPVKGAYSFTSWHAVLGALASLQGVK